MLHAIKLMARFSPGRIRESANRVQRLTQEDDGFHGLYCYLYKCVQRLRKPPAAQGVFPRVKPEGLLGYGNLLNCLYENRFIRSAPR